MCVCVCVREREKKKEMKKIGGGSGIHNTGPAVIYLFFSPAKEFQGSRVFPWKWDLIFFFYI